MTFLTFITSFSILLLLSSIFICSFYKLSRHRIIVNPDNSESIEGFIFKKWSMFWEQTNGIKITYYQGESLTNKFIELKYLYPKITEKLLYKDGGISIVTEISEDEKDKIRRLLNCSIDISDKRMNWYLEDDIYIFPAWVRNPISQCPVCMSSVFGTPIYAGFALLVKRAFSWSEYTNISIILCYVFFVLILSGLSLFLSRKIN